MSQDFLRKPFLVAGLLTFLQLPGQAEQPPESANQVLLSEVIEAVWNPILESDECTIIDRFEIDPSFGSNLASPILCTAKFEINEEGFPFEMEVACQDDRYVDLAKKQVEAIRFSVRDRTDQMCEYPDIPFLIRINAD